VMTSPATITYISCPPHCSHRWDGPEVVIECECCDDPRCHACKGTGTRVCGASASCSLCGSTAMDASLWEDE